MLMKCGDGRGEKAEGSPKRCCASGSSLSPLPSPGLGRSALGRGDESFGDGEPGQTGHAVDIELAHHPFAVRFDGADADAEEAGNFLVAQPFSNLGEDFTLPARELGGAGPALGPAHELVEGDPSDVRAEKGLAGVDLVYSLDQFVGRGVLQN